MPEVPEVVYAVDGRIATIEIDRPDRMNAMTDAMYAAISDAFRRAEADPAVRCVIVSGRGGRAFSAGHDLHELGGGGAGGSWQPYRPRRFDNGLEFAKPSIAAIDGYCLAGGMELALFCDIRMASSRAQFGAPEVKWSILHGYGALRLPDLIGMSNTMYLLLTGDFVDAQAALRMGLVSHVVEPDALLSTAREVAERIASNGPLAARLIKELAYRGRDVSMQEGLRLYKEYSRIASASDDVREGTRAFAEKRTPEFGDR
jgi:enoyl-CoA hydratase/carnithine racemase